MFGTGGAALRHRGGCWRLKDWRLRTKLTAVLLVPLLLLNLGLIALGSWLIYHSIQRLHHYDRLIRGLTQKYRSFAEFVD